MNETEMILAIDINGNFQKEGQKQMSFVENNRLLVILLYESWWKNQPTYQLTWHDVTITT